jgi:hypothetical protein
MGGAQQVLTDLHAITGRLERGEGTVGRLPTGDTVARDAETLLAQARADMQRLEVILTAMEETVRQAPALTATFNDPEQMIGDLVQEVTPDSRVVYEWHSWQHLNVDEDVICPLEGRREWTQRSRRRGTSSGSI